MALVAKSYIRKGFLIYCMRKCANISPYMIYMRRPLFIYDFATDPLLNFLIYEESLIFFFISAIKKILGTSMHDIWYRRKVNT
jgi:hypothetical protein